MPLCRKTMAFWSAGSKCGNYFHAAAAGRRCDMTKCGVDTSVLSLRNTKAIWTAVWFVVYDTGVRVPLMLCDDGVPSSEHFEWYRIR